MCFHVNHGEKMAPSVAGIRHNPNMQQFKILSSIFHRHNPIYIIFLEWVGRKTKYKGGLFCTGHENTRSTQHLLTRSLELGWILFKYAPWFKKKLHEEGMKAHQTYPQLTVRLPMSLCCRSSCTAANQDKSSQINQSIHRLVGTFEWSGWICMK